MRKIAVYMFTTLDGFIAGPDGAFLDYEPPEEEMRFANELFASADGVVFGRVVYEGFVSYWDALDLTDTSNSAIDIEFARIFRGMTRVVVSRTLEQVEDNDILIKDDIAERIANLKQLPGRDLLLVCGPELLATLVGFGLVDEFRLLVRPLVIGRGMALFGDLRRQLQLELLATRVVASGNVLHHYRAVYDPA
ncbi:MAG: dihydrofolate reductase family protein [Chloroflexia bacterium]|nr:dihydrofolate reductase family protein [Chloroflexia bacterium]